MLLFSFWVPHRAEPETRIWVEVVYLLVIPGSRNEMQSELENRAKSDKGCVLELVITVGI